MTESSETPEQILRISAGYMAAKFLFVASRIGLFEALAPGSRTAAQLSTVIDVPERSTRIVADAMVSVGLVNREGDEYSNAPVAQTFLAGATPADRRPMLRWWDQISYPTWQRLEAAVRTGEPQTEPLSAAEQTMLSLGMEVSTSASAAALPGRYSFSAHQRLLDLGGGTGSFARAALGRNPQLSATLFELPQTAVVAARHVDGLADRDRLTIVEGDLFNDPIPKDHDVLLLANVIHLFPPDRSRILLSRVRAAAPDGARLLLVDLWTDPTHTDPAFAALLSGEFLLVGGGQAYSVEEAAKLLADTGWRFDEHRPLAGPASLVLATAG
ncbi:MULTISPECIES: acetylserotonin O-methyltransferase [unclassified Frankia]|uniref:acetylserotonin O-methyltransferase n=2 Tax=Frankia TaxID=1854 RepID=UPI001EF3F747|nr:MULTISPECIES: acetylserotonin O-methyltransferase [unclassified Frankia]